MDQTTNMPKKPKVLLVEDNDTYRKVILNAMRIEGFEAFEAENGQRGLEIARQHQPDLVMVDIYMPVMDGMTMLAEFKKDPALSQIPVVMVTNVQEELDKAVKEGAEEAILKASLTPHQVIDVCRKHLNLTPLPVSNV